MGMRLGMALIAGTLGLGLAGSALADGTSTTLDQGGLSFKSGDAFSMKFSNLVQTKAIFFDNRDVNNPASGARDYGVFSVARYETSIGGTIYDSKWMYATTLKWQDMATGSGVAYANLGYRHSDSLSFFMGRGRVQYSLQNSTSVAAQQFVDRSDADARFRLNDGTGAWLNGNMNLGESGHKFGYSFGVFNGLGADRDQQSDFALGGGANGQVGHKFMYNLRGQLIGNAKAGEVDKTESDLRSNDKRGDLTFLVGAAMNLTTWGRGDSGVDPADVWSLTLDTRIHVSGWAFNGAFFHRSVSNDLPTGSALAKGYTDVGGYLALGYNMNMDSGDQVEVAARVSMVDHDDFNGGNADDRMESSLGLNYRIKGDNLKFSFDANYLDRNAHGMPAENFPAVTYRFQMQFKF